MSRWALERVAIVGLLYVLAGCGGGGENEVAAEGGVAVDSQASPNLVAEMALVEKPDPQASPTPDDGGKVKFKDGSGEAVYSLKAKDDGAKLVDAEEQELARFTLSGSKVKVKGPDDEVLGYIIGEGARFKIEDAEQTRVLFELQRQADGDWKLEDGDEVPIYRIKKRDYGFELEDPAGRSLAKIKVKEEKTSLRDPAEQTLLYTKDPIRPLAMACLGLEAIVSLEMRAGLMFRVEHAAAH